MMEIDRLADELPFPLSEWVLVHYDDQPVEDATLFHLPTKSGTLIEIDDEEHRDLTRRLIASGMPVIHEFLRD
ncbi:hypothetical protein [Dactylosporangium sp. NPDC050588]|uniref:hypothetical protein n=1 Tax=Dactylosporangium sp. NPDC050588 TaxID=3157211 RepID=UPI0033E6811C